ncbi:MAG: thiamine pyrophosphate-dependent enzyme [Nanoarchaeota archaeon]
MSRDKIPVIREYVEPGSSSANKTGSWRQSQKPMIIEDLCKDCGVCLTYCPEGVIYSRKLVQGHMGKLFRDYELIMPGVDFPKPEKPGKASTAKIDYAYCKACGICETTCEKEAISMVDESVDILGTHEEEASLGSLLAPGHSSCAGCGNALAVRYALEGMSYSALKPIVVAPTGCTEIFTTIWPYSAWRMPWVHSLFENSAAVASGIEVGIKMDKARGKPGLEKAVIFAGDGGTADIGLQSLSGMVERGHNVLYIMLDNAGYMNTGIQRSSATPFAASTITSVAGSVIPGKGERKKPVVDIIAAHGGVWSASASIGDPIDVMVKAHYLFNNVQGPAFLQIDCPCPRGWRFKPHQTIAVAEKAIASGFWLQYITDDQGRTFVSRGTRSLNPEELDVVPYLMMQDRFAHLFNVTKDEEDNKIKVAKPEAAPLFERIRADVKVSLERLLKKSMNAMQ